MEELETKEAVSEETQPETDAPKEPEASEEQIWALKAKMIYVMIIVFILCGGNGIGIVGAGLYWKATHNLPVTIGIAVGVTLAALLIVIAVVVLHKRRTLKKFKKQEDQKTK